MLLGKKCKSKPIITCEGETEVLYFEHVKKLVNMEPACLMQLVYKTLTVSKAPHSLAKSQVTLSKTKWYHIIDKESSATADKMTFENHLKNFKKVKDIRGNGKLLLGYTNISFELWLLMHKSDEKPSAYTQQDYLNKLKKLYNLPEVKTLEEFKKESNFKKVLKQITLVDIKRAIKNGKALEIENKKYYQPKKTHSFEYYEENPSTNMHIILTDILKDVGINPV